MAEGGYEGLEFGKLQTAHAIRKQAYWSQLAGGHFVYGHNDHWQTPLDWSKWIDAPGASHLGVFRQVITGRDAWWTMVPDRSLFISGEGHGYGLNVAARSQAGNWALVYLSEPCTVALRLPANLARGSFHARWIDPIHGGENPDGVHPPQEELVFTMPVGWQDALLLIEA